MGIRRTKTVAPQNGSEPPSTTLQGAGHNDKDWPTQSFCQKITSWRVRMALNMQILMILFILLRMNMPIAFVCMIKKASRNASSHLLFVPQNSTVVRSEGTTQANVSFNSEDLESGEVISQFQGEFEWESSTQGLILTASNILGFVLPLMTDTLSRLVGGKRLLLWAMMLIAILTILQPEAARLSPYLLVALRIVMGLLGGIAIPILNEVFSWWAPEKEKVTMVSLALGGVNIGNMLVGVTSAFLCAIPLDNGWPFIFYIQGGLALVWCLEWQLLGSIRPEEHRFISEEEKLYILRTRVGMDGSMKRTKPPYKIILTSLPVWSFIGVTIAHQVGSGIMFTYVPLYLSTVFAFNVEEVGVFSSVGYVARFVGAILFGQLSNLLFGRCHLNKTCVRKGIQCAGFFVTAAGLFVLGFLGEKVPALLVLCVLMMSMSCSLASAMVLPLDLAPRFAAFMNGLSITLASILTMPAPVVISTMTDQGTLEQWRNVFFIVGTIFAVGGLWFLFTATAKLQPWATPPQPDGTPEPELTTVTCNLMTRRLTFVSLGPPLSPALQQNRFQFNIGNPNGNFDNASYNKNVNNNKNCTSHHSSQASNNSNYTSSNSNRTGNNWYQDDESDTRGSVPKAACARPTIATIESEMETIHEARSAVENHERRERPNSFNTANISSELANVHFSYSNAAFADDGKSPSTELSSSSAPRNAERREKHA